MSTQKLDGNVHSGAFHTSQCRSPERPSADDKQNAVCPHPGISPSHSRQPRECGVDSGRTQKATYCPILFLCKVQNWEIHRNRKEISGCLRTGAGGTRRVMTAHDYSISWGSDENVLELDSGGGCKIL